MDMFKVNPIALAESYGIEVVASPFLDIDGKIEKKEIFLSYLSLNELFKSKKRFPWL